MTPPQLTETLHVNEDAELHTLGSILIDQTGAEFDKVADWLKPQHFATGWNKDIYTAMLDLRTRRQPIDMVTLPDRLKQMGAPVDTLTLFSLIERTPTYLYLEHYAKLVAQLAEKRSLVAAASKIAGMTYEDMDTLTMRDKAIDLIAGAVTNAGDGSWISMTDAVGAALDNLDPLRRTPAIPTGFKKLDQFLGGGFRRKRSYTIAGRPAMGKTILGLLMAYYMAKAGYKVAFFSLEMPAADLAQRLIAMLAGINGLRLQNTVFDNGEYSDLAKFTPEEEDRITEAAGELYGLPLAFNPTSNDGNIFSAIRQRHARHGLDAVFFDYIQLAEIAGSANRNDAIGTVSRRFKLAAMAMNMAVILHSQLSRDVEKRTDKRPMLSDMRDSGNIEQDQDGVLGIYRDEYYNPKTPDRGIAEILLLKHRYGPTGKVKLGFDGALSKFYELPV